MEVTPSRLSLRWWRLQFVGLGDRDRGDSVCWLQPPFIRYPGVDRRERNGTAIAEVGVEAQSVPTRVPGHLDGFYGFAESVIWLQPTA